MESSSKENQIYLEGNQELRNLMEVMAAQISKNKPDDIVTYYLLESSINLSNIAFIPFELH